MNPICPDYRGIADMICEEVRAKDAAMAEAQARIEALEWLVEVLDFAFYLEYECKHLTVAGNAEFELIDNCARDAAGV